MRKPAFCGLAAIALLTPLCSQTPVASVQVQTAPMAHRIPRDFVGMSLEVSPEGQGLDTTMNAHAERQIVYAFGQPGAPNQVYFQFMRDLGPGILRLGGNSQDNTCWDRAAAPRPELCQAALTPGIVQLWGAAARATHWKFTVGLNLKQNDPNWALREVDEGVARYLPRKQVLGLEIGNEPEFFGRSGARSNPYTARQNGLDALAYARRFAHDPIARRYRIVGPAACCLGWNAPDLGVWIDTIGPNRVALATVHSYFGDVCGHHTFSLQQLLDPQRIDHLGQSETVFAREAHRRGVPIALAETNSVACGGMPGVSDSFGSAVWGLDWMFTAASHGYRSINFHTSYRAGGSSYIPIQVYGRQNGKGWTYQNIAQPLFYAMYAFARNASGRTLLPVQLTTQANVKAYAVSRCAGCGVTVFLINKDATASGNVSISLQAPQNAEIAATKWGAARQLLLRAPSLSAKASETRYGGAQFDAQGHIRGVKWQPLAGNGTYSVNLPNAAIVIVKVPAAKP